MRSTSVLLLIILGFLLVCSTTGRASVSASGTGIGVRVDGPSHAQVNKTISYNITVVNLGDYWDRNLTVTDEFPNGTSSSWNVPDLSPSSQSGAQYTISGISYLIRPEDVLSQPTFLYVDDNANVTGYAYVTALNVTVRDRVQAEASFPTIISVFVGGYSVPLEQGWLQTLTIIYATLVFAIVTGLGYLRFKFKQKK